MGWVTAQRTYLGTIGVGALLQWEPYRLSLGCVNLRDYEYARFDDPPPPKEHLLWNVVPMAEVPFFKYLFKAKPDTRVGLEKVNNELRQVLEEESSIRLVDELATNAWFDQIGLKPVPIRR